MAAFLRIYVEMYRQCPIRGIRFGGCGVVKYVIIDYCKSKEEEQNQKNRLFPEVVRRMQRHLPRLNIACTDETLGDIKRIRITLEMLPRYLQAVNSRLIQKKICKKLEQEAKGEQLCLLAVEPQLEDYVPEGFLWCEDMDEVFINMLDGFVEEMCKKDSPLYGEQQVSKRTSRLCFVDDGTRNAAEYIRRLSKDWNYVTVCSNRHQELEYLYRYLYEEEGLMVQCAEFRAGSIQSGSLVIDLSSAWKGLHHIYPKGAYILDVSFSHEKEKYLREKGIRMDRYQQLCMVAGFAGSKHGK